MSHKVIYYIVLILTLPLILQFLVGFPHEVTTDVGLEHRDDLRQTLISHVLKGTQHSGLEKDLSGTKTVFLGVELKGRQDVASDLLAVNESLRDGAGSQDGVARRKRKEKKKNNRQ